MPYDIVYIGSSPAEEDCAQMGAANYYELSKLELEAFKKAIIQKLGEPPEGAFLTVFEGEVVAKYDPKIDKAQEYAFKCESDAPTTWEEAGMKAPRLDDPEFTSTDLIDVPDGKRPYMAVPVECDLTATTLRSRNCIGALKNEFFDGSVKGVGSWANMCPACFGQNGVGIGEGRGQHYKKAKDGQFYKVEG